MGCREFSVSNIAGVLGAFLLSISPGAPLQWGLITPYLTSFYKLTYPHLSLDYSSIVLPVMLLCVCMSFCFGGYFTRKFNSFWVLLGSQVGVATCLYTSTLANTFDGRNLRYVGFAAVYGGMQGLCIGVGVGLPAQELKLHFKGKNSRLMISVAMMGMVVNPVLFGEVFRWYVNPGDVPLREGYLQDANLVQQVLPCLRYIAFLSIILGFIGCLLMLPVLKFNRKKKLSFQEWVEKNKQTEKGETIDLNFVHSEREVYAK